MLCVVVSIHVSKKQRAVDAPKDLKSISAIEFSVIAYIFVYELSVQPIAVNQSTWPRLEALYERARGVNFTGSWAALVFSPPLQPFKESSYHNKLCSPCLDGNLETSFWTKYRKTHVILYVKQASPFRAGRRS